MQWKQPSEYQPAHTSSRIVPNKHSIPKNFVSDEDIQLKKLSILGGIVESIKHTRSTAARQATLDVTGHAQQEVGIRLHDLRSKSTNLFKHDASCILRQLSIHIMQFNERDSKAFGFKILPAYDVKLDVYASRHCVEIFSSAQKRYEGKHGMEATINTYK